MQFVWKLPEGGFIRTRFEAEVLSLDHHAQKYFVRLRKFMGGFEEDSTGKQLPRERISLPYWQRVAQIEGKRVELAYEAADERPLMMRLTTLTGEHNFFYRHDTE
ncbi:MAG: hypothetical protein AAF614_22960 [Chloroflexota bacterium]